MVAEAEAALGGVDVAGQQRRLWPVGAVEETSDEEARRQFAVNVFGRWRRSGPCCVHGRRPGGHIVNITSVSGHAAWAGTGVYCASKFALEGLGEALARRWRGSGIRVTNVAPAACAPTMPAGR